MAERACGYPRTGEVGGRIKDGRSRGTEKEAVIQTELEMVSNSSLIRQPLL